MKISLIIISCILVLSVFVPFLLFVLNGTTNTGNIKKQINTLLKDNGIIYRLKDIWRKNFIGISNDDNTLTHIQFNSEKTSVVTHIDLKDVKQCNVIKNCNNNASKTPTLKNLALEFVYKSNKPNTTVNFFNIDEDLSEDYELQRIEKWHTLIKNIITVPQQVKMAS